MASADLHHGCRDYPVHTGPLARRHSDFYLRAPAHGNARRRSGMVLGLLWRRGGCFRLVVRVEESDPRSRTFSCAFPRQRNGPCRLIVRVECRRSPIDSDMPSGNERRQTQDEKGHILVQKAKDSSIGSKGEGFESDPSSLPAKGPASIACLEYDDNCPSVRPSPCLAAVIRHIAPDRHIVAGARCIVLRNLSL